MFAKFTGKYKCRSLFLTSCRPEPFNITIKETPTQVISWEFFEIFKNIFFTEHLWATASLLNDRRFMVRFADIEVHEIPAGVLCKKNRTPAF